MAKKKAANPDVEKTIADKPIVNIEPIKCEVIAPYKDKDTKIVYNVGDFVEYQEQRAIELITAKFIKRLS